MVPVKGMLFEFSNSFWKKVLFWAVFASLAAGRSVMGRTLLIPSFLEWIVSSSPSFGVVGTIIWNDGQLQPSEPEPEFLEPVENFTATQGREVVFTCVVNHLGPYKVAWIKADTKAILAFHMRLVAHNPRLSVTHNGHNTWKLHIANVHKNDSGPYMCQINTNPMRSQSGYLDVVVPPDILNDESSDGAVSLEGGTIRLRCRATGTPDPTVSWRREDSKRIILRQEGGKEKTAENIVNGEVLTLHDVQRSDMGIYLCYATNGVPPTVSKRHVVKVHFLPLIKVVSQLVASPLGSDVTIQCYVEASPAAMNSWHKEKGEKLQESHKYHMTEYQMSEYMFMINLTIRELEKSDIGAYVCSSANALGTSTGVVRVQELFDPRTTQVPTHVKLIPYKPTPPPRRNKPKQRKDPQPTPPHTYAPQTISPIVSRPPSSVYEVLPTSRAPRIFQSLPFMVSSIAIFLLIS